MKRDQYEVSLPHGGMAADYEAESIRGIFRGDGGGTDFDHYCAFWDSSQHHACDYRRDCGRGAAHGLTAVRWGVTRRIVWAWVLTIPGAALMGAGLFHIMQLWWP